MFDSSYEIMLREAAGPGKGGGKWNPFKKKPPKSSDSSDDPKPPDTDPESENKPDTPEKKTQPDDDNPVDPKTGKKIVPSDKAAMAQYWKDKYDNYVNRSSLKNSNDPVTRILGNMLEISGKQGITADKLAKEYSDRDRIIRMLLSFTNNEFMVAEIFTRFRNASTPWSKQEEIFNKVIDVAAKGINVPDALDFALEYYKYHRNKEFTVQVIGDASEIQEKHRELNIFKIMNQALAGGFQGFNIISLGRKNMDDAFLVNKVMAMATYKPSEDVYVAIRNRLATEDKAQMTKEIDDRIKAIFQTLVDTEFQKALVETTTFLSNEFKIATTNPLYLDFRKLLMQLKLATEFRKTLFSAEESVSTSEAKEDKRFSFNSENKRSKFVKVAQNTNPSSVVLTSDKKKPLLEYTTRLRKEITGSLPKINQRLKNFDNDKSKSSKTDYLRIQKQSLIDTVDALNQVLTRIDVFENNLKKPNITNLEANQLFNAIHEPLVQLNIKYGTYAKAKKANNNNKFIRIAAPNTGGILPSMPTLPASGILDPNTGIVDPSLFNKVMAGQNIASGLTAILTGDPVPVVANMTAGFLMNLNAVNLSVAQWLGAPPPREIATSQEISSGKTAFYSMLLPQDQRIYQQFENAYQDILANIESKKTQVFDLIEGNIYVGDAQESSVIQDSSKAEQQYDSFGAYLKESVKLMSAYYDFVREKVLQFETDPDYNPATKDKATILQMLGPIKGWQFSIERDLQKVSNLLGEYSSFEKTVQPYVERKKLIQDIRSLVPNLEAYLATGGSVVDLLRNPGGPMTLLREIYEKDVQIINTLYPELKKWQNAKNIPQLKIPIGTLLKEPMPGKVRPQIEQKIKYFDGVINDSEMIRDYQKMSDVADELYQFAFDKSQWNPPLDSNEENKIKSYYETAKKKIQKIYNDLSSKQYDKPVEEPAEPWIDQEDIPKEDPDIPNYLGGQ